jgi:serine phosphatase RsbU (regulator of sigma subunit)
MNKSIKYYLSWALILSSVLCCAQQNKTSNRPNHTIDSLRSVLKTLNKTSSEFMPTIKGMRVGNEADTIYIITLNNLAVELRNNDPDTSIILSTQALNLSLSLFKTEKPLSSFWKVKENCIAKSYHNLGVINWIKGNYPLSIDYYLKALKIKESLNDKKGIAVCLGNIGIIYWSQGNYPNALDYDFKALKMGEELGDKNRIANCLNNIGIIFDEERDYSKALDYYFKSLKMEEEMGDKNAISDNLGNIGIVFDEEGDDSKALDYYFKALKIGEELGNKNVIARQMYNIGLIYNKQGKALPHLAQKKIFFNKALPYLFKALKINEELGNNNGIALGFCAIGSGFTAMTRYGDAEKYLQKALVLSTKIKALDLVRQAEKMLSEIYSQTNQPEKALAHYKKYIVAKDSIFNEENTKKAVRFEMNFEFEKKQAVEKAEQEKQNEIAQQEKQKQKIILILVSCFLLLVAVFASFMFNRWRITQKQKLIIEKQKEKIVDSITYAQLIQQSILMEESEIQKILPNSFIYFQPKDIVSGDFYWCSVMDHKIIIAAVDCTGHGVPGAFMSMIGNTLLNQIVNEKQITKPSEILKLLNQEVIESLHQSKDGALSKDGMAIALCSIDYKNNQLEYAGAENPLYILADNEITVINADRHGIGSGGLMARKKDLSTTEYTNHIVPIKKDMSIFLFTDGYMDQFGGNDRKKFGIQKFKELLLTNQQLSMQQQKEVIAKAHQDWKKSTAQIDDILVIGVRI